MSYRWQEGNGGELLINGEQFFCAAFAAIRAAREQILLETFIIFDDEVGRGLKAALLEAAGRGVQIDVAVDGYGTADLPRAYVSELSSAGIRMHIYDPRDRMLGMRTNLFRRLHRKILVVDREVAFIGGINFGDDHLPEKHAMAKQDYAVRVTGPIVADLHDASRRLLLDQNAVTDLAIVAPVIHGTGPAAMLLALRDNHRNRDDIEEQYLHAIRHADRRMVLANAYFFPGYRMLHALRNAARRGVRVTLILQGRPDMPWARVFSSLLYGYLLRAGIEVYEFTQRPLHAKVAVMDEAWATVGSSNLDPLSLSLNLEANVFIRDVAFNRQLHEHLRFLIDHHCQRITANIARRGHWWRAPLILVSFHFLRHFPALAGWLPAHTAKFEPLGAHPDATRGPALDRVHDGQDLP